jgi:hypothetical protein
MRALDLVKIAASSEKVRLQQLAHRQTRRAVYFAIAAIFGIAVFCMVHVLLLDLLRTQFERHWASAILLALDGIVAAGFGFLGYSSKPGSLEVEAYTARQRAVREGRDTAIVALLPAVLSLAKVTTRGSLSVARSIAGILSRRKADRQSAR